MTPLLWIVIGFVILVIYLVLVYRIIKHLYWKPGPWYKPLRYEQIRSQVYCSCEKGQG